MTTEEKEFIKKRGSYKGRLTSFISYLNQLDVASFDADQAGELQLRIGKIGALYDQYDEVQTRLEISSEDPSVQLTERSEFESNYFKSLSRANNILSKYNKSQNESEISEKCSHVSNHKPVKLPTIQLPKFSGFYENWLEFRDTFSSLIHLNDSMDEINKFHYLRASLEGSAAVVIQSIEFSSKNYTVAWQLLCERFDNKRLLIQNHVAALFNIVSVQKESSIILKCLIDQINKNLRALESLGEPTKHWDTLLIYIITHKLDNKTYREWEEYKAHLEKDKLITLKLFLDFIRNKADLIEVLEMSQGTQSSSKPQQKIKAMVSIQDYRQSPKFSCVKCKGDHTLNTCPQFLALTNNERLQLLPPLKVCFNCFRSGHYANQCKKLGCKICKRKHHTLIHVDLKTGLRSGAATFNAVLKTAAPPAESLAAHPSPEVALSATVSPVTKNKQSYDVLLSTAIIKLYDVLGQEHTARAVLDNGSTSCLITEKMFLRLNLPIHRVDKSVLGLNNASIRVGEMGRIHIRSLYDNYDADIQCFVLPSITSKVPSNEIDMSSLSIPSNIRLADPNFHTPADIDMIIGADVFWDILGTKRIKLGIGQPILCETRLGWIVSGPISSDYIQSSRRSRYINCHFTQTNDSNNEIQNQLARFWQLDEMNENSSHYLPEERQCEEHFVENTTRLESGRFCVRIPLKQDPSVLGDSFQKAQRCLLSLERKLRNDSEYGQLYHNFMSEYETLGHMSEFHQMNSGHVTYYIPHHGVLRENSTTTKLRVVYNASNPTTSGMSFNDIQMVGPTVQDDLLSILLRFRQHRYILSADVEKMYRQIMVHPDDRYLQQILWKTETCETIKIFQLNTVTYGTASAPFLATRCLKQIALECDDPLIAEIIEHDFYVDDLLTGSDDITEVSRIRQCVASALASACLPLRKWKSNEPQLLTDASEMSSLDLNIGSKEPSKLLGLGWHVNSDQLCFPIDNVTAQSKTKRDMLSAIGQIFDPLGLLAPCVINMKMLLQKLWIEKLSWDDQLTADIKDQWCEIIDSLPSLKDLRIPRRALCESHKELELHIFSDASERAYGACVYVRSSNEHHEVSVHLLFAKSRVAPIKPTTIPRLELCGALTGARLYEKAISSLRGQITRATFWTDSTIVLGWLKMLPNKLQTFVRNRVAEILEKTGDCSWKHVPTYENPADLISRGVNVSAMSSLDLWWSGPKFLMLDESQWPSQPSNDQKASLPETRRGVSLLVAHFNDNNNADSSFINYDRFSNFSRLIRSVAYVLRFINICKGCSVEKSFFTKAELQTALNLVIMKCQEQSFPEYKLLLTKQNLPTSSSLLKFDAFMDENKIIRVGGRLDNSQFSYNKKHPILLQSTHTFTKLLFTYEHIKQMHAGPQLLLATIRETYWPIGGRTLARKCYHQCLRCTRLKGKIISPLMGNLPQQRLDPSYPFKSVGVDYAGPILSASRQGRGCRIVKVYIAIFICFATKAVHLELVGDLTSNCYLLALRRFIARRGKPVNIYSDNGTAFVGAYNDLSKFLKSNCDSLSEVMANEGISFHFIPAYSPHFGGLWEAGVKATKFHLSRVLGNCYLTYEELNTTLIQIEAILNSRPLTPLSSNPEDLLPLTPGHFLIGRPLTALPEPDYHSRVTSHLTRFQRIAQLQQQFWKRWSREYVSELQQRSKWRSRQNELKLDTLVVIKDDNMPPLKWRLGRITAVYPGPDGINRVADIRTSSGTIRRAFSKICPLMDLESSG